MWIKNNNDFIVNQEMEFSPQYSITYNNNKKEITITKNGEYIKNFYGENISEITAIAGENGSGKTTLAKVIYNNCYSVNPISKQSEQNSNSLNQKLMKIIMYEKKNSDGSSKIITYYYLGGNTKLNIIESNCSYDKPINLYELKNNPGGEGPYSNILSKHGTSVLYFTNAFDINNSIINRGFSESKFQDVSESLCFTPMHNMRKSQKENKESYGFKINLMNHINILKYANLMALDPFLSYSNYQSYDFLIAFKNAPTNMFSKINFDNNFNFSIREFADGVYQDNYLVDNLMTYSAKFLKDKVFYRLLKQFSSNCVMDYIFVNLICEFILFIDILDNTAYGVTEIDIEIPPQEILDFDTVINNLGIKDNEELLVLLKDIMSLKNIDMNIIKRIISYLRNSNNDTEVDATDWFQQIIEFEKSYDESILKLYKGNVIKLDDRLTIEFLTNEYEKDNSVYKRMIILEPIHASTGELSIVNLIASIFRALRYYKKNSDIILIIDELDIYLHPRWQQDIIHELTTWLSSKLNDENVQLIFTTHSPILLSDITNDRLLMLKKNKGLCEISKSNDKTFCGNSSKLFQINFFMDKGSIGEFSKSKIQYVLDVIKGEVEDDNKKIEYILSCIAEPLIKLRMTKKYREFHNSNKTKKINYLIDKFGESKALDVLLTLANDGENND